MDEAMEVDAGGIFRTVPDFRILSSSSSFVKGWVSNEESLQEVIDLHSIHSLSQFVSWHDDRTRNEGNSGVRLLWKHKDIPITDGEMYPFSIDRHIIRQCSFGKAHKRGEKNSRVVDFHSYSQCERKLIQPTRKVSCEAKIKINYVTMHVGNDGINLSQRQKCRILEEIREKLKTGEHQTEKRIYVTLPLKNVHTNHQISSESVFSKRVHQCIINKIQELVLSGITHVPQMKKSLKIFVETKFQNSQVKPSIFDRSFYPTSKDIKNHIYTTLISTRLAGLDQDNLRQKIDEWKAADPQRHFFYREATVEDDDTNSALCRFLVVHQEGWQQKLMKMYGNTISLLDATYKTTKYALPLFLVVVKTNVGYMPVAQFIVEDEVTYNISEALAILKSWNREWNPNYFMVDYCEAEINAIEAEFDDCCVLQCAFHREQAWERRSKSDYKVIREDFLDKMRQIAYAPSISEFDSALENLHSSDWFKNNPSMQNYIKNRWINIKERWCRAFKDLGFHAMVTTTNGVETLNKTLKHSYLKLSNGGSLSNLFEVLITDFLQDLFQSYAMLNYRSSSNYKSYSQDIPEYLHNRPRCIVEHCLKRISSGDEFKKENVLEVQDQVFSIISGKQIYEVYLGSDITFPYCQCDDFRNYYLPCKHFFAIFNNTEKGWNDLSNLYLKSPYLTVDQNVLSSYICPINNETEDIATAVPTNEISITDEGKELKTEDLGYHHREVLSELKSIQNLVYNCSSIESLQTVRMSLINIKTALQEGSIKESGLPLRKKDLRPLPRRKKSKNKYQKRVGRKAQSMTTHTCTGLPEQTTLETSGEKIKGHSLIDGMKRTASNKLSLTKEYVQGHPIMKKKESKGLSLAKVDPDEIRADNLVQGLWSLPKDFYIPVAKVDDEVLTDTDIRSLRPREWLTDKVITYEHTCKK